MTICDYEDRLDLLDGKLVRVIKATSRSKRQPKRTLDVYREDEDGNAVCRNLYSSCYNGYRVGFPNDTTNINGYTYVEELQDWGECPRLTFFPSRPLTEAEKALVVGQYPEFRYVLAKWQGSIVDTMKALDLWKEHKEIELVLASGYQSVAFNKSFWKLTEKKRKEIALFMRKNPGLKDLTLSDIQTVLKHGLDAEDWGRYKAFCRREGNVSYDTYKYLVRIGMADGRGKWLYRDYQNLLSQTQHNGNDVYWKFPSDLQARHDRLMEEVRRIRDVEEAERNRKKAEELMRKQEAYVKAVKKLFPLKAEIGGYTVYVPETIADIKEQADKLHQCLITCDYVSQVADNKCVLVFVRRDGKPVATAQILDGDRIGQFYADELDRSDCLPDDDVRRAVDRWLELKKSVKESRRKAA